MSQLPSCPDLLDYLSEFVDGTLEDRAICDEIESHLTDCEDCRVVLNTLEKTVELYHASAKETPMPPGARERLFQCLDLGEFLE